VSESDNPLSVGNGSFDGDRYQARFDDLVRQGADVHGEARFVLSYAPESVLDAGCGTGRVALELARHGVLVVGVDKDASMLAVARRLGSEMAGEVPGLRLRFVESDLAGLLLEATFDVVLMAGNVPLFTEAGSERALVAGAAKHVPTGGVLVAGFQLDRGYPLELYDLHCAAAGLVPAERYATWDRQEFEGGPYAVSVHTRP
jgi:SAM-dependent methyltransferase